MVLSVLAGCEKQSPQFTEIELDAGIVRIYDFGEYKLHNYETRDPLDNQVYVLETPNNLIGIDGPVFAQNIYAWQKYIKSLNKPIEAILTSYNPNGGYWQYNAKNYATEKSVESRVSGAIHDNIIKNKKQFGKDYIKRIIPIDYVIPNGKQEIAETEFVINDKDDGYTIEIPIINIIYIPTISTEQNTPEHIDAVISDLKQYRRAHYKLILTPNNMPTSGQSLTNQIRQLRKLKRN